MTLVFAIAYWRLPAVRPAAAFVAPVLFVMMGWLLVTHPGEGHFPPTYRTVWLYVHVGLGKVFLGAVLVAVGISAMILARPWAWRGRARAPPTSSGGFRLHGDRLRVRDLMLDLRRDLGAGRLGALLGLGPARDLGLPDLALGCGVPACARRLQARPEASALMIIGVFALAFLTFFGVPFVSTAPHKGAI